MIDVFDTVEEVLKAQAEKNQHAPRQVGIFYPSEALQCPRKCYFSVMCPEEAAASDLPHGLFYMAKAVEAAIIGQVRLKHGLLVEEQKRLVLKIAPGVTLHGYLDFCLVNGKGKVKEIFEIKSTAMLKYMLKETEPKQHHKAQLMCYLHGFKAMEGAVVYVERGDLGKIKQFDVQYDEEFWDRIVEHFKAVAKAMKAEVPPPPKPIEKWECNYCAFRKLCKATP
jgi:CRISPR/Cas system-associated exonuclease Cas4 (RecB family)